MMRHTTSRAVMAAVVSIGFSGLSISHASECNVTPPCPAIPCQNTPTADSLPVPTYISAGGKDETYFWDGTGTPPILEVPLACHNPSWQVPHPANECGEPATEGDKWAKHLQLRAEGTDTDRNKHKYYIIIDGCCDLRESETPVGDTVCVKWTGTVDLTTPGDYTLTAHFTNPAPGDCPMTVVDTKTVDITVRVLDCTCTADRLLVSNPNPDERRPPGMDFDRREGDLVYYRAEQTYTKTECMRDTGLQSAIVCGGPSTLAMTQGWTFGGSIPISAKVKDVFSLGFNFTATYTSTWTFSGTASPVFPAIRARVKVYQKYITLKEAWKEMKYEEPLSGYFSAYLGSRWISNTYGPLKMEEFQYSKIQGGTDLGCLPEGDRCEQ